ncbi:MAG: HD domain-containing protein [Chloroflexi bacterium]|nr:MAG: HD domain-containing protein [Chloroflexota bacterium]
MRYTDPMLRDMMHVKRWAIVPTTKQQSIAEHQYFVMLYTIELCKLTGLTPTSNLLTYAALHDVDEIHSGDIPAPYKHPSIEYDSKYTQNLKSLLTGSEISLVKLADLMEATMFLIDEANSGNKRIKLLLEKVFAETLKAAEKFGVVAAVTYMLDEASDYRGRLE